MALSLARAEALLAAGDARAALALATRALRAGGDLRWRSLAARSQVALGDLGAALALWAPVVQAHPRSASSWRGLAKVLLAANRLEEALPPLQAAAQHGGFAPADAQRLAEAQRRLGRPRDAERTCLTALRQHPRALPLRRLLLALLHQRGAMTEAAQVAYDSLRLAPDDPLASADLAHALHRAGQQDAALAAAARHAAAHPRDLAAAWQALQFLPQVYDSRAQMDAVADAVSARQAELVARTRAALPAAAAGLVGAIEPHFGMHYQGRADDRPLQRAHGALVCDVMAVAHPPLAAPLAPRPRRARLRVAFVSAFVRQHTVGRLFAGWMQHLDPARFEVHVWHLGAARDALTDAVAAGSATVHHVPRGAAEVATRIRETDPDAVIFPEIGMHTATYWVAASRLAPVQAQAWGHPVPSGLPTMTHFLTSDWMEPRQDTPSTGEALVRLPRTSLCIARPPAAEPLADRFGVPRDRPIALCAQSLFKLQPRQDAAFAALAERVPSVVLAFVRDPSPVVTARFVSRLRGAFSARGLDLEHHVRLLPRVPHETWMRVLATADLLLDSHGWSGGHTTLEALALGRPVVTLAGQHMRGRHTSGMLHGLGLADLVPASPAAWVDAAATLASSAPARDQWRARLAPVVDQLFDDQGVPEALGRWLEEAVAAAT